MRGGAGRNQGKVKRLQMGLSASGKMVTDYPNDLTG